MKLSDLPSNIRKQIEAKFGKPKKQHGPNKTESAYGSYLSGLQQVGEIVRCRFEGLKFRLAQRTSYCPDFIVTMPDNSIQCHEVKARWGNGKPGWRDDARVKIKVAAELFPEFTFVAVWPNGRGGWNSEYFCGPTEISKTKKA